MSAGYGVSAALSGLGVGARESASSLLRTLARDAVVLRLPSPPIGDNDGEELGWGTPQFTDLMLAPALVHESGAQTLVTLPAIAVETALGVSDAQAVEDAVRAAVFVRVSDRMLQVKLVERRVVFGRAYLYRLLLVAPELE